jgi:hypothetical protein
MPKPLIRSFFFAIAVLFLFATSSALGAHRQHSERTRAGARRARVIVHRRSHAHKAAHRAPRKPKTPPVKTPAPLEPVSPVEPVPPITPTPPTEPAPTEPIFPVTPPASAPPTASFSYSPASPVTGQAVSFNGTSSTCPDGPCTYEWSDDGGATRPIPALWPLGSGQTLSFTFAEVGTKYARLVVTDATGQTATVEHNITVGSPALPPPPAAPAVTTMPAIAGTATEGDTLSTTTGAWTGSPTAYAYQWRHCTSLANTCTNIAGAVTSSYKLASSDVGQKMSVTVTATNAGGAAAAHAPMTAIVTTPVPPAPANTTAPVVSGTATEGQSLTATAGVWAGEPSSYAYQWQDCNALGEGCLNVSGATGTSHALAASDVGSTVRVVVSATNAGGSTSASSAVTAMVVAVPPPPPVPPTASFSYSPASPVTGQAVSFDATGSTCPDGPCTYEWSDDGGATRPIPALWPLGSGQTLSFTFAEVGTKYIRLVVTDAAGQTDTVEHNVVVAEPAPLPPVAPSNTASPVVSGTPEVGQTLSASTGTWTGAPTAYAYQWQDCNTAGESCANIGAAGTSSSYKLVADDVGHTLRAVVTATNDGGSTPASSTATVTVVAEPPPPPPVAPANTVLPSVSGSAVEGQTLTASSGTWTGSPTAYVYQWEDCNTSGGSCSSISGATAGTRVLASGDVGHTLRVVVKATNAGGTGEATSAATVVVTAKESSGETPKNCFPSPEGCGYPGPKTVGVESCSGLPKSSGTKTITKSETIENTDITGYVVIDASGVTLNHDCVDFNGGESEGSAAVVLESAASNFTISNTTVRGENTTSGSFEEAIRNNHSDPGALASKDRLEDCAECIHQLWTLDESYVIANGRAAASGVHTEDWWFDNNTITANDDTLLNPSKQTAVIFAEASGACENHEKVTNSLIAGGGFMFYFCTHASSIGKSTIEIKNNRFARRVCAKATVEDVQGRGGWECSGSPNEEANYLDAGEGTDAFYPRGGFFGVASESPETFPSHGGAGWEGNYWDDSLATQGDETK